jgi:hydroxymethylpyrimidine pyrophosphatase-like HAD family hydrolase
MTSPIRLLSTDFDGTLHAEYENPPVPNELQELIARLQARGMAWVINTGRDLSSLMETLGRAQLSIWPDYVVTVEREIHLRADSEYQPLAHWNLGCERAHRELFARVRPDVLQLTGWIKSRFHATIYEDPYSPLCLIAGNNLDADVIHAYLLEYCRRIPDLTVVRNDVYARFSHACYNKGTALAEIARLLGVSPEASVAAGDHLNDLPMLSTQYARWLIAPGNAVPVVKDTVRTQQGLVCEGLHGHGVLEGLRKLLASLAV